MIVADVPFATTSLPFEITVFYDTGGWDLMLPTVALTGSINCEMVATECERKGNSQNLDLQ
jgi:hypothetical protein